MQNRKDDMHSIKRGHANLAMRRNRKAGLQGPFLRQRICGAGVCERPAEYSCFSLVFLMVKVYNFLTQGEIVCGKFLQSIPLG